MMYTLKPKLVIGNVEEALQFFSLYQTVRTW